MSKPKVLQIGPLTERFHHNLAEHFDVTPLWQQPAPQAFLKQHGSQFELVATSGRFGCSAEQIAAMPNLKAICSNGVGYDAIAVDLARDRGIAVSNTPDVLNDCVADLTLGLMIDTSRQLGASERFLRAGNWPKGNFPLARRVSGKRLGIVGLGRIGQAVVKRASGFDMDVRYHNRSALKDSPFQYEANLVDLARWADFLVLTCVGGASTHHIVNAEVLAALGPTGILINVARGSVVDEPALVAALQSGALGGAGLDVFEGEPQVPDALLKMENVMLLPHVGSATEETRLAMEELVLANLAAFIERGQLITPL